MRNVNTFPQNLEHGELHLDIAEHQHQLCCCWVTSVVSDSARPRPWESPGKNTGVGCHFLPQCIKVRSESEVAQSCQTLRVPMDCSLPGSSVHGIFQARVLEWGVIAFSNIKFRTSIIHFQLSGRPLWAFSLKMEVSCTKNMAKRKKKSQSWSHYKQTHSEYCKLHDPLNFLQCLLNYASLSSLNVYNRRQWK